MDNCLAEIKKQVYSTYPITKREKCCALHKAKMEAKRESLSKRLMNECTREKENWDGVQPSESEICESPFSECEEIS